MAKLYAELSAHENRRKVSRASNTRLKIELFQGNKHIGTLCAYPITGEETGHRITWHSPYGLPDTLMLQDTDTLT